MPYKKNKIKTMLIATGLILTTQASHAQVSVQFPDCSGSYNQSYQNAGCSQDVWNSMCNAAKVKAEGLAPIYNQTTKDQVMRSPEKPAQSSLNCLQNATNQLKSLANGAQKIYNMILGVSGGDWSGVQQKVLGAIGGMACRAVDSYVGQQVNTVVGPITSTVTSLPNTVLNQSGLNNIQTPVGNVNSGSIIMNEVNKAGTAAGGQVGSWGNTVGGAVTGINNTATGAVTGAFK